jgi:hypothetical protein
VGKKPPQSQKGSSHGLTPRMSAGHKSQGGNKKNKNKQFYFLFLLVAGDVAELRGAACAQEENQFLFFIFYFLFF